MPYHWLPTDNDTQRLHLWPHRSLTQRGFVWFIGVTAMFVALPLIALLGSPALWVLMPFVSAAIAAIWWALRRNIRDGQMSELLVLTPESIRLTHTSPTGESKDWQANPHWVRVELLVEAGPVPQYIVLKGGPRDVELGAFLSEDERVALCAELRARLSALR